MRDRRVLLAVVLGACSAQTLPPQVVHLERPTDIAFACIGSPSMVPGDPDFDVLPPAACDPTPAPGVDAGPDAGTGDAGAETIDAGSGSDAGYTSRTLIGYVLDTAKGTVAVSRGLGFFDDYDPFTPGFNGLVVGRLPIEAVTTPDGCWVVTANAGSCDLSGISVIQTYQLREDAVERVEVKNAAGEVLAARPGAILAPPSKTETKPSACGATPAGTVYVAYPTCHLVARIDLATGEIQDGIRFRPGQPPEIVGPDVTCPAECIGPPDAGPAAVSSASQGLLALADDAGIADAGVADAPDTDAGPPAATGDVEPTALAMEPDGTRIYAGGWNDPNLLAIDLDGSGAITGVRALALEDIGGIRRLAATGEVLMSDENLKFRFVYAIGRDRAIHVVNVTPADADDLAQFTECDTQIDRRYLSGVSNRKLFSCFPIGDPQWPRRAGARGPGIRIPGDVEPRDVAFYGAIDKVKDPEPNRLNGVFALVTALGPVPQSPRGLGYLINVDDDNYEDSEIKDDTTFGPDVALALPHTLRDDITGRRRAKQPTCVEENITSGSIGMVRIAEDPAVSEGVTTTLNGKAGDVFAPMLHRVPCDIEAVNNVSFWELSGAAPPSWRRRLFADLERIPLQETFIVAWEGPLTLDPVRSRVGGAVVRSEGAGFRLDDPAGFLCDLGTEERDIVQLVGCDNDSDCSPGETCYSHPEAPVTVRGMCLPETKVNDLASLCRNLLISERRYTAVEVGSSTLLLMPRPRVLDGTPLEGCDIATESTECSDIEKGILSRSEAASGTAGGTLQRHDWTCETEANMGGPPRCLMACTTDKPCDRGSVCLAGRCLVGPPALDVCLAPLQRYGVNAHDAFTVLTSTGGYGKHRIIDRATGRCMDDPDADPLEVGRFRRDEPPCVALDELRTTAPNPCLVEGATEPVAEEPGEDQLRSTRMIRFRTPGLAFDVTDVTTPIPEFPGKSFTPVPSGYNFRFRIAAGFFPRAMRLSARFPDRIRVAPNDELWVCDPGDNPRSDDQRGQVIHILGTPGVSTDGSGLVPLH